MRIVILTKSGQAPTKAFAEKLLKENIRDFSGDMEVLAGMAYMDPKVLSAGIARKEVDKVFVISLMRFPPTAYELSVIEGKTLRAYGESLGEAEKGVSSWDIARNFTYKRN